MPPKRLYADLFNCRHPRSEENTITTLHNGDICKTCNRERMRKERADEGKTRRSAEIRMVREFRLPPKPKPILSYDPNYGRSYGLAPGRVSSRVERGEK